MKVLEENHITMPSEQTDRGRYCESSNKHGVLLLQFCNLVIVELEAFLQLFPIRAGQYSSFLCLRFSKSV